MYENTVITEKHTKYLVHYHLTIAGVPGGLVAEAINYNQ